ncbi:MAG: hypothetical protein KBD16_00795 [Candidatus Pacebacteria bacterium]|nr:hypothetical protein [Candidatus Paceibacterota bacterium]
MDGIREQILAIIDRIKGIPALASILEQANLLLAKVDAMPTEKKSLELFCLAIRDFEGKPGDLNYRNNNPGNCKFSTKGYAAIYGHVGKDKKGFAIFKDYETGWLYLKNLVREKVRKNPNQTILDFMKVYAPASDNNPTVAYADNIAKKLGVTRDYPMKLIV